MVVAVGSDKMMMESVPPMLVAPPPPSLSSVSTFHPCPLPPPNLMSPLNGMIMGHSQQQNHLINHHNTSSFSSSCGSSSSTTGSVSGGGGGGGQGGIGSNCGNGIGGETSSRCSGGSSSISGSNPRLNANPNFCNKTPIQTIPPPLSSSTTTVSLYQVHDGFATVRKRKGTSAAAIAMRQQEEIYDLAQPIAVPTAPPTVPMVPFMKSNGFGGGNGKAGIKSRHSFMFGKTTPPAAMNNGHGGDFMNMNNGKSASLLSTHPSLNLGKIGSSRSTVTSPILSPTGSLAGGALPWEHVSGLSSPLTAPCGNPGCQGKPPWHVSSCECPCKCLCTCGGGSAKQQHDSSSSSSSIRNARTANTGKTPSSTTSLGRKLRKFVLPNSSSKNSNNNGGTSPTPSTHNPPPHSVHQFHSTSYESVPISLETSTMVPIRKSPSATAALGNGGSDGHSPNSLQGGQYYHHQPNHHYAPELMMVPGGLVAVGVPRLRNSISDNSIAAALHRSNGGVAGTPVICVPNSIEVDVSGGGCSSGGVSPSSSVVTSPTSCPGSSASNGRHFHRSCFLPKAPPLEPVMEDGIPWRQTRKDVPWWELAIRRGRYRSCPLLQASPQAHVVAAFEQSLSNMTQRLQTLSMTAEQKDSELNELRTTIELLRKQSVEAGVTVAQMAAASGNHEDSPMARQLSADSVSSINSISSACSGTSHSHTSSPSGQVQMTPSGTPTHGANLITPDSPSSKKKHAKGKGWLRSSFTKAFSRSKSKSRNDSSPEHAGMTPDGMLIDQDGQLRQINGDTYHHNPLGQMSSASQGNHHHHQSHRTIPQHYNQHLQHHYSQNQNGSMKGGLVVPGNSMPTSPLLNPPTGEGRKNNSSSCNVSTGSHSPRSNGGTTVSHDGRSRQGSSSGLSEEPPEEPKSVDELKKQLREKEMVLTDIRLEALTSAHQLESLKETVTKMRNEMLSLKQDNERLQRMVTCKSLTSSQTSLQMTGTALDGIDRRLSASEVPPPSSTTLEMFLTGDATEKEGKRIVVTVYLGSHGSYERYISPVEGLPAQECIIGTISVCNKTKWDALDSLVKRAFKDYLMRIDPMSSLGLSADSVLSYAVGEVLRSKEGTPPELLPCGYLVGDVTKIRVCLKGALYGALDALAFETLVPKSVLQRYMSLLGDQGRIIICGPSGTGKSYLARKLGEYLVARSGKDPCPEAIASFSADHKNSKELRQYLTNLVEQCDGIAGIDLPSVIILDNLHQVQNLGEVFNGVLLKTPQQEQDSLSTSPVIIGTMTQSQNNSPPTAVQVHHSFRWILFGNHTEPVKGLLSRYLQRRLIEVDTQNGSKNLELARIVDWIPKVWHHINKFLEAHNSADVTIGPRLFLSCPMDVANSQVWFTDLWHYSVVPYLTEATKEGLQIYGKKAMWEDPAQYLLLTYPWPQQLTLNTGKSTLQRIRPEDVGYDMKSGGAVGNGANRAGTNGGDSNGDPNDPLMNMLMRLQEAANYSGPQSNDSDSTSLDSHVSLDPKDFIATA